MNDLPTFSIVIPTRDRIEDLTALLHTILKQDYLRIEVIIVDDSSLFNAENAVKHASLLFNSVKCTLKYVKGSGTGLPDARNLGIQICTGDAIFFLDDDTLLDSNVLPTVAAFLNANPDVLGVQPEIISTHRKTRGKFVEKLENAIYKVLMLSYHKKNVSSVRRSGSSILPKNLTQVILAKRLSGCCCCYKREVFDEFRFDTNLKRWGYMEDLDFSYRIYKKYPQSLYAIPNSKIIHKTSNKARLPTKLSIGMTTIYWFYIFFKDIFDSSISNLLAFSWALAGNLSIITCTLIAKRKPKREWWTLIHTLSAYATAFKNLRNIRKGKLDFFNKHLQK